MSLGAVTLTISVNAVNKVLKRINQDDFKTRYYLHEALEEWTVNVRHSQTSPQKDGIVYDNHNVELIHTIFATSTSPARNRVVYMTFRNVRDDDYTTVGYDVTAMADLIKAAGNIPDLLGLVG